MKTLKELFKEYDKNNKKTLRETFSEMDRKDIRASREIFKDMENVGRTVKEIFDYSLTLLRNFWRYDWKEKINLIKEAVAKLKFQS